MNRNNDRFECRPHKIIIPCLILNENCFFLLVRYCMLGLPFIPIFSRKSQFPGRLQKVFWILFFVKVDEGSKRIEKQGWSIK